MADWCDVQAARDNGYPGGMYIDPDGYCAPVQLEWNDCTTAAVIRDNLRMGRSNTRAHNTSKIQSGGKTRNKYKHKSTKKRRSKK